VKTENTMLIGPSSGKVIAKEGGSINSFSLEHHIAQKGQKVIIIVFIYTEKLLNPLDMREVLIVLAKVVQKFLQIANSNFLNPLVKNPCSTSAITCDYQETTEIRLIFLIPNNRSPIQSKYLMSNGY